ncbi:MAG: alkylmercury lyase family protein [Actinomycetota bacterium]
MRRAAFRSILDGEAPDASELARVTVIAPDVVEDALRSLVGRGEAVVDGENRVVGTAGLSLVPARHRLRLGEMEFHTWCAIDAIGIPAALGADAVAHTACPTCGQPIEVAFREGQAADRDELRAWLPTLDCCTSVVDELCPEMNLFCSEAHLEEWRRRAGHPAGVVLTVEETEELGWRWWGGLA